ncbi:hypothetical protein BJX96DRAFT_141386 [Aspergillus floccosus]
MRGGVSTAAARVGTFNTRLAAFLAQEATAQRHQTGGKTAMVGLLFLGRRRLLVLHRIRLRRGVLASGRRVVSLGGLLVRHGG